ncbi:Hypothetical protein POVR1_LOCUS30 [uncultured virus]|nr:Hypothetical protein POVR1_LOCUS30 [uncultured virus]
MITYLGSKDRTLEMSQVIRSDSRSLVIVWKCDDAERVIFLNQRVKKIFKEMVEKEIYEYDQTSKQAEYMHDLIAKPITHLEVREIKSVPIDELIPKDESVGLVIGQRKTMHAHSPGSSLSDDE